MLLAIGVSARESKDNGTIYFKAAAVDLSQRNIAEQEKRKNEFKYYQKRIFVIKIADANSALMHLCLPRLSRVNVSK